MNKDKITILCEKDLLDLDFIHNFISNSYWAKDRSMDTVKTCVENSLNFGVYLNEKQVGYARVVTDYVVFAYLMDLFIDPPQRGKGFAKLLIQTMLGHAKLKNIKVWKLSTSGAQRLYQQFGFTPLEHAGNMMERKQPEGY